MLSKPGSCTATYAKSLFRRDGRQEVEKHLFNLGTTRNLAGRSPSALKEIPLENLHLCTGILARQPSSPSSLPRYGLWIA